MPYYLQTQLKKLLNPKDVDPQVQKSIAILNLLVGEEETNRIKTDLKSQVDTMATGDKSPPLFRLFRA